MKKIKLTYVISGIDYAFAFDWVDQYMDKSRFELNFVFLNSIEPDLHRIFLKRGVKSVYLLHKSKADIVKNFFRLVWFFASNRPDVVHFHLFDACLAGLPASWITRISKRIYTRHHSTLHFDYHPHMVKYDKMINYFATDIIAITSNVKDVLIKREHVRESKITLIHHGFVLNKFSKPDISNVEILKRKYNPGSMSPVIGVIARFTEWKGIQFIIPAFVEVLKSYPNALLLLANAKGDNVQSLFQQLKTVPEKNYMTIEFEKDLYSLYQLFDVYVHVPVDECAEAFGQTYVEALAAGIPSVFTLSGVAREFVKNEKNALVVPFKDTNAIYESIVRLLDNNHLAEQLSVQGKEDVNQLFVIDKMMNSLFLLYEKRA